MNPMSFANEQLLPGENLILLARQHTLVLFRPFLLNIFVLVVLAGVSYYSQRAWLMAFLIFPLVYLLWEYLSWRNREYILTDRRVVRQEGVLSISSFDAPLDKINNVFHTQSFMGRILKYGEVALETASEQGTTTFEFLSHPVAFKNAIVHQRELYKSDTGMGIKYSQQTIPQLIEELASLRSRNIITESEFQEKKRSLLEKM
jgi:uncharacterized membrane protein YdbT with pleckstrin-like domain